jgi:hypothetical protein
MAQGARQVGREGDRERGTGTIEEYGTQGNRKGGCGDQQTQHQPQRFNHGVGLDQAFATLWGRQTGRAGRIVVAVISGGGLEGKSAVHGGGDHSRHTIQVTESSTILAPISADGGRAQAAGRACCSWWFWERLFWR